MDRSTEYECLRTHTHYMLSNVGPNLDFCPKCMYLFVWKQERDCNCYLKMTVFDLLPSMQDVKSSLFSENNKQQTKEGNQQ